MDQHFTINKKIVSYNRITKNTLMGINYVCYYPEGV